MDGILAELAEDREQIVLGVLAAALELDGYAALDSTEREDLSANIGEGVLAVCRALAETRALDGPDLTFLGAHIRRRARTGVPQGDMLSVVRAFERVLWDRIVTLAGDGDDGREAVLLLTGPLLGHIETLSQAVQQAFDTAAISQQASPARREMVEQLLLGIEPAPGVSRDLALRAGLGSDQTTLVLSAVAAGGQSADDDQLHQACLTLIRAASIQREPVGAVRSGEVVMIGAVSESSLATVSAALRRTQSRLATAGIRLAIGLSTLRQGWGEIPAAYHEACLARGRAAGGGLLAMFELSPADYLIMRGGDGTAWQLLPEPARRFVAEDIGGGGVLCDTLLAYIASNLSVKLAAESLFVHPNTAHYRLSRIEERTGLCVRHLDDVLTLAIAVRLYRAGHAGVPAPASQPAPGPNA